MKKLVYIIFFIIASTHPMENLISFGTHLQTLFKSTDLIKPVVVAGCIVTLLGIKRVTSYGKRITSLEKDNDFLKKENKLLKSHLKTQEEKFSKELNTTIGEVYGYFGLKFEQQEKLINKQFLELTDRTINIKNSICSSQPHKSQPIDLSPKSKKIEHQNLKDIFVFSTSAPQGILSGKI